MLKLYDVLAKIWAARVWILVGVSLGVPGSIVSMYKYEPPYFTTKIPVKLLSLTDNSVEKSIRAFNQAASHKRVLADLENAGLRHFKPNFEPYLESDVNGFTLNVVDEDSDQSGKTPLKIARSIAYSINLLNQEELSRINSLFDVRGKSTAKQNYGEQRLQNFLKLQSVGENEIRLGFYLLEEKIRRKLGIRPEHSSLRFEDSEMGASIVGMIASGQTKLTTDDKNKFLSELSNLMTELRFFRARFFYPHKELLEGLNVNTTDMVAFASGLTQKYPTFEVDEELFQMRVRANLQEHKTSKFVIHGFMGAALGAFLGLMLFCVRDAYRKLKDL